MTEEMDADILIIGAGGAGLLAALHALTISRKLKIVIAVKGLLGQSGCTRMVQGGYNAVLNPNDSLDRHFADTIKGGAWINHQELAWKLVEEAPRRIIELENQAGCLFDRNPDGTIHQKAFAGQSFDRTVHRGDLTGIEIMSNLRDSILETDIRVFEECRGVELLRGDGRIGGALLLDIRGGRMIAGAREGDSARDRRGRDDVSDLVAIARKIRRRNGHGVSRRRGFRGHGDAAISSDGPAGGRFDRHRRIARRRPARRRRAAVQRAGRTIHGAL